MAENIFQRKLTELFKKHSADGSTPRKLIISGMSREMRFCKSEIEQALEELHLENEIRKQKIKKGAKVEYERNNQDNYFSDLKSSR